MGLHFTDVRFASFLFGRFTTMQLPGKETGKMHLCTLEGINRTQSKKNEPPHL